MDDFLKDMIISASGWRKVFAADGDEHSAEKDISENDRLLTAGIGHVFAAWALSRDCRTVVSGRDARPTGNAICSVLNRVLASEGLEIRDLSICSAPEIMAYTKETPEADAFIYVSASHNPRGHNGVKFGLGDGSVAGGKDAAEIISLFREYMSEPDIRSRLVQVLNKSEEIQLSPDTENFKNEALKTYLDFNLRTAFPEKRHEEEFIKAEKPSIIADMNGSARALSIDREFFDRLGIRYAFINDEAGNIAHGILPEGKNLESAAEFLRKKYSEDSSFTVGYMPDNDGDRGNLVFISENGEVTVPDAQTVFALAFAAELSFMEYSGMIAEGKTATAVNCPTSMRIEKIASLFGVKVFRSEVGEANVVNLAAEKRAEGYCVRFLGEGSNGGNITHPATVRDPLNTIMSIIKFRAMPELYRIWCTRSGARFRENPSWDEMIATLPEYRTTATDDPLAKMQITCTDHGLLKNSYEEVFAGEWEKRKKELEEKFGFVSWKEVNYIGTSSIEGTGPETRSKGTKGGLKIIFSDRNGTEKGFIWMRGSGTEPVFRILADSEGADTEKERWLIEWQRNLVSEADRRASR